MDFIDKLKYVGSETYKFIAEKTSKIARETKLKMRINQNKSQIEDLYEEIGKAIYQAHIREEETDVKQQVEDYCCEIDFLCDEIEDVQTELLNLKDKKKCNVCAKEMDIEDKFCPQCGKEQPKVRINEVEIVDEDLKNSESEVINETDDVIEATEITENKNEQEEYAKKENNKMN